MEVEVIAMIHVGKRAKQPQSIDRLEIARQQLGGTIETHRTQGRQLMKGIWPFRTAVIGVIPGSTALCALVPGFEEAVTRINLDTLPAPTMRIQAGTLPRASDSSDAALWDTPTTFLQPGHALKG